MDKDFTKLNPLIGLVAGGEVIGSVKMDFFSPDGSASNYEDMDIPTIKEKLTAMLSAVEGTEMRHMLILLENLTHIIERSAIQGGKFVAMTVSEAQDISLEQKEISITAVRDYFQDATEKSSDDPSDLLNKFFVKGKPH